MYEQLLDDYGVNRFNSEPEKSNDNSIFAGLRERTKGHSILLLHPQTMTELNHVAENAKAQAAIILSLEKTPNELRRRVLDYCAGLCAGLELQMNPVTELVYVLASSQVEITSCFYSESDDWSEQ